MIQIYSMSLSQLSTESLTTIASPTMSSFFDDTNSRCSGLDSAWGEHHNVVVFLE